MLKFDFIKNFFKDDYDLAKAPYVNDILEKCINCKKNTIYTMNTHIDDRLYYIEGVGQLCSECYKKIYKNNKK